MGEITSELVQKSFEIIKGKDPENKKTFFLNLAAVNLLNAAAKKKEFKEIAKYKDIKRQATYLFSLWVANRSLADEASYDIANKCLYIRCYSLQFSFHYIFDKYEPIVEFIHSEENKPTTWDGVKLQPIATDLFNIAVDNSEIPKFDISFQIKELLSANS